jgi:hypothetical protein
MKTLFYSLLVITAICLNSSNVKANFQLSPYTQLMEVKTFDGEDGVLFKIKFHYERGYRNEAGICIERGICVLKINIGFRVVGPGALDGEIVKDSDGNVLLIIDKSGMSFDNQLDIKGAAEGPGNFLLSNDSDLPKEAKIALGLPSKYQFKAGSYQVTETEDTYMVNFGRQ